MDIEALDQLRKSQGRSLEDMASVLGISKTEYQELIEDPDQRLTEAVKKAVARELLAARMQLEEDENEAGQNDSPAKSKNQQGPAIQDRIKRVKKESGLSTYTLSKRLDLAFEVVEKIIYGIKTDATEVNSERLAPRISKLEEEYRIDRLRL